MDAGQATAALEEVKDFADGVDEYNAAVSHIWDEFEYHLYRVYPSSYKVKDDVFNTARKLAGPDATFEQVESIYADLADLVDKATLAAL